MASVTSSRRARNSAGAAAQLPEVRTLEAPLRALAHARRVAPLLYFEMTAADARHHNMSGYAGALARALRAAVGALLRRNDRVVAGPGVRWFAALLLDRAVPARERAAVSDADVGIVAGRLRAVLQAAIDALPLADGEARASVRAGWTIIEPRDGERPLSELRHALRGAAVVARLEERRATVFAAITHELRTPLTSILGYAEELAARGWEDVRARKKALAVMADEARRLARLVEGLIDTGSWQAGRLMLRRRPTRLRAIADRASHVTAEIASARAVRFTVRGDAEAAVDRDRMLQVLVNIFDNAARHARAGGHVRVALRKKRASSVSISVSDDGGGFAADALPALGVPFAAGPNGRRGLGLAITKMLVEAHCGTIAFTRSRRGGACVTVELPA